MDSRADEVHAPLMACSAKRRVRRNAQTMAARKGLEPLTFALGKRCSILLSYRALTPAS